MIDIDAKLAREGETKIFKVILEDEEGSFTISLKKPNPVKMTQWTQMLFAEGWGSSDIIDLEDKEKEQETIRKLSGMMAKLLPQLHAIALALSQLAISWEGVEGDFSQEKFRKYLEAFPEKAAFFATGFISQYQNWRSSLRKNSEAMPAGSEGDNQNIARSA